MNTPVSFELAKLLKEKGYDEQSLSIYQDGKLMKLRATISNSDFTTSTNYSAPTITEVVMWLYEKHRIWIEVTTDVYAKFCWLVKQLKASNNNFNSPTEAYEAAIEYTLTNLALLTSAELL